MAAADPFEWLGHTLHGRYRFDAVTGEGGFGVVYRGHHLALGVSVAIKCLKVAQELGAAERAALEARLTEEGQVLHQLSRASAAVVQALDVGSALSPNGIWTPYLVLEWLDGHSLEDELRTRAKEGRRRWPLAEAIAWLTPAAQALGEAHAQRVAHRDIKPANLFLSKLGERSVLKVLDFGIAKVLHDSLTHTEALRRTGHGPTAFTPQYGAPEQFDRRKGATGPWTDVHALALVLSEMLSGKPALDGDDVVQLMACALDRELRPTPRAHGVEVGDALEAVLTRALAVMPEDRYADGKAFWNALTDAYADGDTAPQDSDESPAVLAQGAHVDTASFIAQLDAQRDSSIEPSLIDTADWIASRDEAAPNASTRGSAQAPAAQAASVGTDRVASPEAPTGSRPATAALSTTGSTAIAPREARPRWPWVLTVMAGVAALALLAGGALDEPQGQSPPVASENMASAAPSAAPADSAVTFSGSEPTARVALDRPAASASAQALVARAPDAGPSGEPATQARPAPARSANAAASAGALAPPGYCAGATCRVDGQCSATLIGKVVVCRAASDGDCSKSYGCTVHGACHARNGDCVALGPDDCNASLGCKQTGECAFRNGKCLQELITDCNKYPICKSQGMCTARDNACWATSDAMCAASDVCASSGRCRSDGKHCVK